MMHTVTPTKYLNYPSTLLIKYSNVLAQAIKSHDVHLLNMTPYKKCAVIKSTCAKRPY